MKGIPSNSRVRLTSEEIEYFGFPKKKNNRYYLNQHNRQRLLEYRGLPIPIEKEGKGATKVTEKGQSKNIEYNGTMSIQDLDTAVEFFNIDLTEWEVDSYQCNSWDTKEGHTNYQVKLKLKKSSFNVSKIREILIKELEGYSPKYPKLKRKKSKDDHMLMIDPADCHIGKLCSSFEVGEEYNSSIAVQRIREGVKGILNKASGWNLEKIMFVIGNDILHIDTPKRTTTSGTPQDTDGMWYDNFLMAYNIYVEMIETLMTVADVHIVYNPSNHDYTNGFFLAQMIQTHFRKSKNITFDVSISHRKYYTYHKNLIGTTHGDGAKSQDLPLLMAHEAKTWSETKHKYVFIHHFHHKMSKDYMGVCVEALRSPSGTDSWHSRNGYEHAPKAIEGYLFHPLHGQTARFTHLF